MQEAVNAAPDNINGDGKRFVIYIKERVYEETVRKEECGFFGRRHRQDRHHRQRQRRATRDDNLQLCRCRYALYS